MGLLLLPTTFLSLLVIGITFAAEVPAGSDCPASGSGNTCITNTVCDKVHGKCLLKAGQACSAGNENNCISGASCVLAVCKCGTGYTKDDTTEICAPNTAGTVGSVCTSGGTECTTRNSECSSLLACKCKTGFVPNIENGECDGIVGTTCTAADTCVVSSVCDKVTGKCLLKADQTCSAATENNCVSGASCVSNACACGAGYTKDDTEKTCTPNTAGTVGSVCTSGGTECTTRNSECSSLLACKCKTGFVPNIENGKCDGIVGTTCTAADTCVVSSVCDKVTGKCLLKAEQTCTAGTENCVSGASCVSDACTCGAGYTKETDKTCKPAADGTVGFGCTSLGNECTTPNSECSSLGACKCKTGFVPNIDNGKCDGSLGTTCTAGDTCVASSICDKVAGKCSIKYGLPCTGNTDKCVSNAECAEGVCKCDTTKSVPSSTGLCYLKTDQSCTEKSYCVVGATCLSSKCKCSDDFAENATSKLCEAKPGIACSSDAPCVTSSVCESGKCLIKHGQSCTDNANNCVPHASCASEVCQCDASTTVATPSGLCSVKSKGSDARTLSFWLFLLPLMSMSSAYCAV